MKYRFKNLTELFKNHPDYDGHTVPGMVNEYDDIITATGVHRIAAGVHLKENGGVVTTAGGIRIVHPSYGTDAVASVDVMRMPIAMSKKFAGLSVPLGGAKTIVYGHNAPEIVTDKAAREELWRAFAYEVMDKIPHYIAAEDVGTTPEDMRILATHAPQGRVAGCSQQTNPSPTTARGVVIGIQAALNALWNEPWPISQPCYAVQGIGSVGSAVLEMLWASGARQITVADIDEKRVVAALAKYPGLRAVSIVEIHRQEETDVFVPCALGGILNEKTAGQMLEEIGPYLIAGCANNQLAAPEVGDELHDLYIEYAPDYIINAGGAAEVVSEITGCDLEKMLLGIGTSVGAIVRQSIKEDVPSYIIADNMVAPRVAAMRRPT